MQAGEDDVRYVRRQVTSYLPDRPKELVPLYQPLPSLPCPSPALPWTLGSITTISSIRQHIPARRKTRRRAFGGRKQGQEEQDKEELISDKLIVVGEV